MLLSRTYSHSPNVISGTPPIKTQHTMFVQFVLVQHFKQVKVWCRDLVAGTKRCAALFQEGLELVIVRFHLLFHGEKWVYNTVKPSLAMTYLTLIRSHVFGDLCIFAVKRSDCSIAHVSRLPHHLAKSINNQQKKKLQSTPWQSVKRTEALPVWFVRFLQRSCRKVWIFSQDRGHTHWIVWPHPSHKWRIYGMQKQVSNR